MKHSENDAVFAPGRYSNKFSPSNLLIYGFLGIVACLSFYPFLYVLSLAVMPYENYIKSSVHFFFDGFTLEYFENVLRDKEIFAAFMRSIIRVVVGTTLNVGVTMLVAYALSRKGLKYGKLLTMLFLIPMYFNAGLIPYYTTLNTYGLTNKFLVLILPGLVSPMLFFIAKSNLAAFPEEVLEAARVDGAGPLRIFIKILCPCSIPIITTLVMMYGLGHWNEYFWTRILVKSDMWTAPAYLYGMVNSKITLQGIGVGTQMEMQSYVSAVAALLILPVIIAYPLLQKHIVKGMTVGAVKG